MISLTWWATTSKLCLLPGTLSLIRRATPSNCYHNQGCFISSQDLPDMVSYTLKPLSQTRMLCLLPWLLWHGELHPHYPEQGCFVPYLDFSEMVGYTCKTLSWTNILFFKSLLSGILYYSNRRILNTENGNLAWGYCSDEPDSIVLRSSGFICCKKHVEEFGILGQTCPHIQTLSKLSMMQIWKRRLLRWKQTVETWGFRG